MIPIELGQRSALGQILRQHRKLEKARLAARRLIYFTKTMHLNRLWRWKRCLDDGDAKMRKLCVVLDRRARWVEGGAE